VGSGGGGGVTNDAVGKKKRKEYLHRSRRGESQQQSEKGGPSGDRKIWECREEILSKGLKNAKKHLFGRGEKGGLLLAIGNSYHEGETKKPPTQKSTKSKQNS